MRRGRRTKKGRSKGAASEAGSLRVSNQKPSEGPASEWRKDHPC